MGIRDVREIGFNSQVDSGGRSLHVQTEVTGRVPAIRTTVLDGGAILHSTATPCDPTIDVADCQEMVREIHEGVVTRATRGDFG